MDWLERALCRGLHTDFWHPPVFKEERTAPESHYYEIAKMVCEQCSVREQCLKLGAEEEFGVWGGTTPKERRTGEVKLPKKILPLQSIPHAIPKDTPERPVDIPAVQMVLKQYTDRRVSS